MKKKMQSFLFLSFCLLPFLPKATQGCSSNDCCWKSCFDSFRTVGRELDYAQLYQVLETVRGAQASYGITGTVYGFDRSANNSNVRTLQRNLAAVLALAQPVSNECNPIFISSYSMRSACAYSSERCIDKCTAARRLQSKYMISQTSVQGSTGDTAGLACYQGRLINAIPWSCRAGNDSKMVVIFANSPVSTLLLNNCFLYDVGVAIRISGDSQLLPFVGVPSTANLFQLDLQASSNLVQTSSQLLSCAKEICGCTSGGSTGRKKREVVNDEEEGGEVISYFNETEGLRSLDEDQKIHTLKVTDKMELQSILENLK